MVCRELRGLLAAHYVSAGSQGMEKNVVGRARVGPPQSGSLGVALAARRAALPRARSYGVRGGWLSPAPALAGRRGSQLHSASFFPTGGCRGWAGGWPRRVASCLGSRAPWRLLRGRHAALGAVRLRASLRTRGVRLLPALALAGTWVSRRLTKSLPPMARLCGPAVQPSGAAGPGPAAMGL